MLHKIVEIPPLTDGAHGKVEGGRGRRVEEEEQQLASFPHQTLLERSPAQDQANLPPSGCGGGRGEGGRGPVFWLSPPPTELQ